MKQLALTRRPIIKTTKPHRPQAPHHCRAADRYLCLAKRHATPEFDVSVDMARCLNGCSCKCHEEKNGAEIADETWQHTYGGTL